MKQLDIKLGKFCFKIIARRTQKGEFKEYA